MKLIAHGFEPVHLPRREISLSNLHGNQYQVTDYRDESIGRQLLNVQVEQGLDGQSSRAVSMDNCVVLGSKL